MAAHRIPNPPGRQAVPAEVSPTPAATPQNKPAEVPKPRPKTWSTDPARQSPPPPAAVQTQAENLGDDPPGRQAKARRTPEPRPKTGCKEDARQPPRRRPATLPHLGRKPGGMETRPTARPTVPRSWETVEEQPAKAEAVRP